MNAYPDFSYVAKLIAEPARAAILNGLMDGSSLPAGELAYRASVSAPTISSHLAKLVEGGLITVHQQGRHRYFKIADASVAEILEKLGTLAPPVQVRSLRQSEELKRVRRARTCYDHLAGELGVGLAESLVKRNMIILENGEYAVTEPGKELFSRWGIRLEEARVKRRVFAKACLDWSERRFHISGWLGAAMATRFFELGWIERVDGSRAVRLTEAGKAALREDLGYVETIRI
ncbi:ArsR/SmtB family transcription factor [Cohnella candidum]|uniref:ArsR family transcriptional regulator n=1 Tax=Cohnella candidum TaxID=2674991 RepID=A0A3G3K6Z0_9BACL|nr:winged helix-turn-helix domain-containing protein [Cohnella candidum]AYQ75519.1 ArsR family transcriptional regulator [Cohnella candidum]